MRYGDWNKKNRELYEATVNRANNTCTLNPYRTKYLQALHKKNMDEDFRGAMWYQMTGEDNTDDEDDFVLYYPAGSRLAKIMNNNPCGKPEMEDEQIRKAIETLKKSKVVGEVGTLLTTPCGKPHNNGEYTPHDCNRDIVLTSMPPQYQCSVCGRVFNN